MSSWSDFSDDNVMSEARNLRNMTMTQTPLLGDENTPLHVGPQGGTGFEGATPRHQVAFTPNPLATPVHAGGLGPGDTPRTDVGATPGASLRTPMRDGLRINAEDGFSTTGDTPREQRLRTSSTKRALQAGFMNLPKPENNFELLVPEDEEDDIVAGGRVAEEDAAERDARLRRQREEEERKTLARRSQVVQRGLPRPPNVDVAQLMANLTVDDEATSDLGAAARLVHAEIADLLHHDSIAYPIPGTIHPGGTRSAYQIPPDDALATAKSLIHEELAASVGYPGAGEDVLKRGVVALSDLDEVDESLSWVHMRNKLVYDVASNSWVEPSSISHEARVAGYKAHLEAYREAMSKDASKASKAEKKLNVLLGGYQARSGALAKRITDAFSEMQKVKLEYESFSKLRTNETAMGPIRLAGLKEEVEKLEQRERRLQERYGELDAERRDAVSRVGVLEERVMAEAEALNEEALAAMEAEG